MATPIIDCAVHPQFRDAQQLRGYLDEPWRSRPIPATDRYFYPHPTGDLLDEGGEGVPGSDPAQVAGRLFDEWGVVEAILIPQTRGLLPDIDLDSMICAATNRWLAETWLEHPAAGGRFRGSIRVNPRDPERAVAEIEHWAKHPHMVQIAVPLQAHHPYGQRQYFSIWEAAAHYRLPVLIHLDGGSGIDYWPTAVGYPRHYAEYAVVGPLAYAYHLISFLAEGVFDRLPAFRVIFGDGGADLLMPLTWRMDKNWRSTRVEMPWMRQLPSRYYPDHVRFVSHRLEGNDDPTWEEWLRVGSLNELLLYGSNYPYWDTDSPHTSKLCALPDALRRRLFHDNAVGVYGFAS